VFEFLKRILHMPKGRNNLPSLLARASSQTGEGATLLFHRLDADGTFYRKQSAEMLTRLAEHLRAGVWNSEIAEIVSRAEAILKLLEAGQTSDPEK
jgi:hypothetical protein